MEIQMKHLFTAALAGALVLNSHTSLMAGPKPPPPQKPPPPPPPSIFQTVDDYNYIVGETVKGAENTGLAIDLGGDLFASGIGFGNNPTYHTIGFHGLVRASADGGNTWALLDDFSYPGLDCTICTGIASDPAGNLYTIARSWENALGEGVPAHWVVQRSTDGGATWSVVDDLAPGGFYTRPNSIAVDAAGNVYVVGDTDDNTGNIHWTVRKGIGGTNFTTVDSQVGNWIYSTASAVFVHPTAGIFVVGESPSLYWTVRRSQDGGATWKTVDTFTLSKDYRAEAFGVGADALGNIYVVGQAANSYKGNGVWHWVVRKGANGGTSWSTVDNYQLSAAYPSIASKVAVDSNGNLFVAGCGSSNGNPAWGTGTYQWIVRENPGGNGTWTTVDDVQDTVVASALSLVANGSGSVFVGGFVKGSGPNEWIVRKH